MIGIVKLALRRPYTFVVMAMLILIFGVASALRTPTDIFPNINIPVISVVFSYTGLPPDDMAGRVVTFYERSLTTSVNDIEHIESQSIPNYGIIKIFFQPTVNINAALAQVSAMSQTVLKQMPAGITPPLILSFNASSVPILQLALSSDTLSETTLFDDATSFIRPQLASVAGAAIPLPYGGKVRQVQADLNQQALHTYGISANDVVNALSIQNLITPVGTQKIGKFEYTVNLNDSPSTIAAFNDLPIKTVNGTVIYMRDVAYVHDGSPPQTNVVHVDGKSAVLLSVVKAGATSTLSIISGIKQLLPSVAKTLPSSLNLTAVGDQSVFVTSAVSSVIREGVIAAALTGMMILLFLGSWRSTLIITVSIPLAILASVTALSLLGETINVMTLGGLALAVGILVDDATVTIENINWHLEHGKEIETAILDGAQQIVVPATVSLMCICIAFVPMFGLGGVAGYLFRPLAEAVVFALIASYVLSRTLVPTLANYLLRKQSACGATTRRDQSQPSRNPLVRFQRGFERRFEAIRSAYSGLLQLCLHNRVKLIAGFMGFTLLSFALAPYLGQDFFPSVDGGQIKMHVRAQTGTRIEETTKLADRIGEAIHKIIPANELDGIVDNIGLSVSGINMAYNNSGTIGVEDADILISLKPNHAPTADYVKTMREQLPRQFPGTSFAFLPADMVSQILNFGVPAPIDLQVVGNDVQADRKYANELLSRIKQIPGIADARIQQAFQQPTLNVNVDRSLGRAGRSQREGRGDGHADHARRQLADLADLLAEPADRRLLSGLGADAAARHRHDERAAEHAGDAQRHRRRLATARRPGDDPADTEQRRRLALQRPAGHRHLCDAAGTRSRRRGRRHSQGDAGHGPRRAERCQRRVARPGDDDDERLSAALRRPRLRDRADLSADRRQLPVMARSVRDRHGAADRACRHRLDAVRHRHDALRPGAHRGHHVHGRRHREQHSGDQLRARTSGGRCRCACRGPRGRQHAVPARADDGARDDHRHGADGDRARPERAARSRRDRRPAVRHLRDAVPGADHVQRRARPRPQGGRCLAARVAPSSRRLT